MCQELMPCAAWAAVYAKNLGIKHDEACASSALSVGAAFPDPLLQALCLRWLATRPDIELSAETLPEAREPVVAAMRELALAARGRVSSPSALTLPSDPPGGPERNHRAAKRLRTLRLLSSPFDREVLPLALAFVEARRGEWAIHDDNGEGKWAAEKLRRSLVDAVLEPKAITALESTVRKQGPEFETDTIGPRLENRLVAQPPQALHRIAMTGPSDLRKEALRAIAIAAVKPEAGDFAACAAAFESDLTAVRIEGARTFLMLLLRIGD